jgi:hypothetical protein
MLGLFSYLWYKIVALWGLIFCVYDTKLLCCGASSLMFTIQNCCVGDLVFDVYVTKLYVGPHILS